MVIHIQNSAAKLTGLAATLHQFPADPSSYWEAGGEGVAEDGGEAALLHLSLDVLQGLGASLQFQCPLTHNASKLTISKVASPQKKKTDIHQNTHNIPKRQTTGTTPGAPFSIAMLPLPPWSRLILQLSATPAWVRHITDTAEMLKVGLWHGFGSKLSTPNNWMVNTLTCYPLVI